MELLTNCSIGIILIILGIILKLWPPEQINNILGYRTPFAMKNKAVWHEANRFSGIMMIVSGVISLVFSLFITFLYKNNSNISIRISLLGSIVIALSFIFYTEIHLRKVFDKNGNRKLISFFNKIL